MKKKILVVAVLVLFAGLALWLAFHKKREIPVATGPESQQQQTEPSKPQSQPRPQPTAAPAPKQAAPAANAPADSPEVPPEVKAYVQEIMADPQYDWKQPINFYGKVVDENNQPLAGASVHFKWTDLSDKGTAEASTTSDSSGMFSLTDQKGKRMSVSVSKTGYYTPKGEALSSFEYANPADGKFTPDAANPVVYHLRKKGEAAPLIHGTKLFGTRIEGTLSYVDLVTGENKLTPPGDLTVRCVRSERNAERKFDWTFTLAVPDGGLIESTNEFMFLAPEDGYKPSFEISQKVSDPNWTGGAKHRFFVMSRNGKHYARIEINIMPHYRKDSAAYDVEWFLNPTGSRNLEYDRQSSKGEIADRLR